MMRQLSPLEEVWESLEQAGEDTVFQRIDESHPGNFYAALDAHRRRGLVLISNSHSAEIPDLENLEIDVSKQQDGRWRTCIWVAHRELHTLFASLAQDIVSSSRTLPDHKIAQFMAARIVRWRELLESGNSALRLWELRGLVAELIVLKRLCGLLNPIDAVDAWQGPFGAPQDFIFQQWRIEAKAVGPVARKVRITSADQLEVPAGIDLRLAVVILSDVDQETPNGFTIADLVSDIRSALEQHQSALQKFEERLRTAGVRDIGVYNTRKFRLDGLRSFVVDETFPRIVRAMLIHGVSEVVYNIDIGEIGDFERAFGE